MKKKSQIFTRVCSNECGNAGAICQDDAQCCGAGSCQLNSHPFFTSPLDGSIYEVAVGEQIEIDVVAADNNTNDVVTIGALSVPQVSWNIPAEFVLRINIQGSNFGDPVGFNPTTRKFTWTPTEEVFESAHRLFHSTFSIYFASFRPRKLLVSMHMTKMDWGLKRGKSVSLSKRKSFLKRM